MIITRNNVQRDYNNYNLYLEHSKSYFAAKGLLYDYSSLKTDKKYGYLNTLYTFGYTEEECLSFINQISEKNFTRIVELSSNVGRVDRADNKFGYNYLCAATSDFHKRTSNYTYNELVELIDSGLILPLNYTERKEQNIKLTYEFIDCLASHNFSVKKGNNGLYYVDSNFAYYPMVLDKISQSLSKQQMLEDIRFYIEDLVSALNDNLVRQTAIGGYDQGDSEVFNGTVRFYELTRSLKEYVDKK